MILTDSQWRTIVALIQEAQRYGRLLEQTDLYELDLVRAAEAAYLVQVDVETAARAAPKKGTPLPYPLETKED